jgi:hypothetical protein
MISRLLPMTYSLNALQRTVMEGLSLAGVCYDVLGFSAILLPTGLAAFLAAAPWAKRDGSLEQY